MANSEKPGAEAIVAMRGRFVGMAEMRVEHSLIHHCQRLAQDKQPPRKDILMDESDSRVMADCKSYLNNADTIGNYLKSIVQLYRMRSRMMGQRAQILAAIASGPGDSAARLKELRHLVEREEKVLSLIEKEGRTVEQVTTSALAQMKRYLTLVGKEQDNHWLDRINNILVGERSSISYKDLNRLLVTIIAFLEKVRKDMAIIRKRMDAERNYLDAKNPEDFRKLLDAWEAEVQADKAHAESMVQFLEANKNVVRRIVEGQRLTGTGKSILMTATSGGSALSGVGAIMQAAEGNVAAANALAAVTGTIFLGFVVFTLFFNMEQYTLREEWQAAGLTLQILQRTRATLQAQGQQATLQRPA